MKISSLSRLILAATAVCSAAAGAADLPKEVRITYSGGAQLIVQAKADGSLEKAFGTPVKWVQFATGADVLTLLAANEVDIANFGSSPTVTALVRKLPVEVVGVSANISTYEHLSGRDNIRTLKDLEGKTVAYPPNSTAQYALDTAIAVHHIDRSKIKLVPLKPADIVAAWKRKDIDAAYVWAPFNVALDNDGGHSVFATKDLKKDGYLIYNNYVVTKAFAAKYPKLVATLLRVHQDKIEQYLKDPDGVSQTIARELGATPEAIKVSLAGLEFPSLADQRKPEWLGDGSNDDASGLVKAIVKTTDFLAQTDQVRKADIPKSFAGTINPSFLKQAAAQR
jgi:taurine transport system substrate-binding protein